MEKFNNAMAANKEWAADYMNKYYKPGEGLPYNEKFGIGTDSLIWAGVFLGIVFFADRIPADRKRREKGLL